MARRPSVDDRIAGRFIIADLLSHAARILSEPLRTPEEEAARAEAAAAPRRQRRRCRWLRNVALSRVRGAPLTVRRSRMCRV